VTDAAITLRHKHHARTTAPEPTAELLARLRQDVARLLHIDGPRYRRLWAYYRNPMRIVAVDTDDSTGAARPYRQAQEWGLPSRITGVRASSDIDAGLELVGDIARKEVDIENDIAWRVDTMVDSLFGKSVTISSAAIDPARRAMLGELLRLVIAQHGGVSFLQQMALIGGVYGFVDVVVKLDRARLADLDPTDRSALATCAGVADLGHPPVCDDDRDTTGTNDFFPTADADPSAPGGDGDTDVATTAPAPHPPATGPARGDSDTQAPKDRAATHTGSPDALARVARLIRLEIVEPARALPVLSPVDVRNVDAYAQAYALPRRAAASTVAAPRAASRSFKARWIDRVRRSATGLLGARDPQPKRRIPPSDDDIDGTVFVLDLLTPSHWYRYEDDHLVASGINSLGVLPLVHVQNVAQPFTYEGASDVEPLLPLQDELNTRLSDRAHRITLQSFKMYLGKGIEGFTELPVTPGQMWATDNADANVIEFGGDAACPSEDAHIAEVREALDKTSGVTPIAAGAIKGRIGRLTSAAALRVTLQALLNRTEKKRTTYGAAIERICELSLAWLDAAGVLATTADERRIEINWPSPIPQNESELLDQAEAKLRVGVPRDIVLRELGY
jgi:hypothetical protein